MQNLPGVALGLNYTAPPPPVAPVVVPLPVVQLPPPPVMPPPVMPPPVLPPPVLPPPVMPPPGAIPRPRAPKGEESRRERPSASSGRGGSRKAKDGDGTEGNKVFPSRTRLTLPWDSSGRFDPRTLGRVHPGDTEPNPDRPPFNEDGSIDWEMMPRPHPNAADRRAMDRTGPSYSVGRFAYGLLTGLLGLGIASAPENPEVAERDAHDPDAVGYGLQALNIALTGLPVGKILRGIRVLLAREALGSLTAAERVLLRQLDEAFTPISQAISQAPGKPIASRIARGLFGEKMAADALAAEGHEILLYKPTVKGVTTAGFDLVTMKDGVVYFVDNKALTRPGNINSVTSLVENLAKNTTRAAGELASLLQGPISDEERLLVTQAIQAISDGKYVRMVTNANLAPDSQLLTGVSQKLGSAGIQFKDVFK